MLFRGGWITQKQFEQAMLLSARHGDTPGCHLVKMGAIADEDLVDFFVRNFPLRYWPRFKIKDIPESALLAMSPSLAKQLRVIPIKLAGQNLTLGLTDPSLTHVAEEAAYHTKLFINPVLLSESDMTWALEHYYRISSLPPRPPSLVPPRETRDFLVVGVDKGAAKPHTAVNVTDNGWDIDEWGIADVYPDDDDAIPLYSPRPSRPPNASRAAEKPSASAERSSFFSTPSSLRATLPPPPLKSSASPEVRRSTASMMLKTPEKPVDPAPAAPEPDESKKSTDNLLIPKSLQQNLAAQKEGHQKSDAEVSKKTISEIMSTIYRSTNRDEIIHSALDFLLLFARRAAFLLVKKDEIRGYDIKGDDTNLTAIKSYWIPYDSESTFKKVTEERQIHLGPFGRSVSDAVFSAALGGRPLRVLVIPVVLSDRVAGLLYADKLRIDMPPWNFLERIAEVTGTSLYRLLMDRKKT